MFRSSYSIARRSIDHCGHLLFPAAIFGKQYPKEDCPVIHIGSDEVQIDNPETFISRTVPAPARWPPPQAWEAPGRSTPLPARYYQSEGLDPGAKKGQTHYGELKERPLTTLNIDCKQMGLGGGGSWGAHPMAKYKLPYQPYSYAFWLLPANDTNSPDKALRKMGFQ